ncbi:MAG: hypothetical protein CMM49_02795 [Rhodospirillaceae bacterium]|nr:hypothetical protein [Rhodospirillaceae bacterium]|tara:strand:+ start:12642 stop:14264 length:1623 start_codon:yes stop_codon:yes gene_type:complete
MKFNEDILYFVPLGGSNEIGMNLNLYGYNNQWIIVDMGIMFAGDDYPGVDIVIPNTEFIDSIIENIKAIFITHAHEDHIGGVPYLFEKFNCPIYLTNFAKKLLETKIRNTECEEGIFLKKVEYLKPVNIGHFEVIYGNITHSIPESSILSISVGNKTVVHSGDWKIDKNPLIGNKTDIKFLKNLSKKGVDVLICDSTNVFNKNLSGSENDVRKNLLKIIKSSSSKRIFITTFASNIARLSSFIFIAEKLNINICFIGGSLNRSLEIAKSCGYLQSSSNYVNGSEISNDKKTIIVCTGCQGEPRAVLSRIANDDHQIKINKDDLLIFSSKIIPGNEKKIGGVINKITRLGVEIITEKDELVHVSGHPGREELEYLYEILKPKSLIPVHGEARHILEHVNYAKQKGINNQILINNGNLVNLSKVPISIECNVPSGKLLIDSNIKISPESDVIKERIRIKENGVVFIVLIIFNNELYNINISSIGVLDNYMEFEDQLINEIKKNYKMKLIDKTKYELIVRQCVNRILKKLSDKRPKVIIKYVD